MESDFSQTIGSDNMEALLAKLGNTNIEQIAAWNMLSDMSVEFDDSIKRNYIRIITKHLNTLYINQLENEQISNLFKKVASLQISAQGVPSERLAKHIIDYCLKMKYKLQDIKTQSVKLESKKDGQQLGFVVKVKTSENKELTYYAKTHSEGSRKKISSQRSAQPVNYIEPLTYKVLDILGIGPQSHLFGRDERNFYIMTLDISTNPKTMQPLGDFLTFDKINKSEEKGNYLGKLSEYKYNLEQGKSDAEYVNLINQIEKDEKSKKFCYEITKMNLLIRMIYILDLYDNSDNFGFTLDDQGN